MTSSERPLSPAATLLLALLVLLLPARSAPAQEADSEKTFQAEARVTAIDLAVAVRNSLGSVSRGLDADDLQVSHAGTALPVVSLSPVGGAGGEPWRLVVWVDGELTSRARLVATAASLARQAGQLTDLGSVEIVLADPEPRLFLEATRDRSLVDSALSRLALEIEPADRLETLRRAALERRQAPAPRADEEETPAEAAAAAAIGEIEAALAGVDRLLTWVAEEPGRGPRALLLVHGGFDTDPRAFYRRHFPDMAAEWMGGAGAVAAAATATAHAVAGYGWVVLPLAFESFAQEPQQGLSEFDRLRYETMDGTAGESTGLIALRIPLGKKDRQKAEKSLPPLLADPGQPLAELAAASGGGVVGASDDLPDALRALGRRQLLTFQAPWPLDGALRPVEVRGSTERYRVQAPRWVRSGPPEAVAQARVRRILAGAPDSGALTLDTEIEPDGAAGLRLTVRVEKPPVDAPGPAGAPIRLTLAQGRQGAAPSFEHTVLERGLQGEAWSFGLPLEMAPGSEWAVVMLESLTDGLWGAAALDPSEP